MNLDKKIRIRSMSRDMETRVSRELVRIENSIFEVRKEEVQSADGA